MKRFKNIAEVKAAQARRERLMLWSAGLLTMVAIVGALLVIS